MIREEAAKAAAAATMEMLDRPEPGGDGVAGATCRSLRRDPGHGPWGSFSL